MRDHAPDQGGILGLRRGRRMTRLNRFRRRLARWLIRLAVRIESPPMIRFGDGTNLTVPLVSGTGGISGGGGGNFRTDANGQMVPVHPRSPSELPPSFSLHVGGSGIVSSPDQGDADA